MAGTLRPRLRALAERLPRPVKAAILIPAWRVRERWTTRLADDDASEELVAREGGGWPLPPPGHRVKVVATVDPAYFLRSGKAQLELIGNLLARNDIALARTDEALDFGCGCGRMARWWPTVSDSVLHGCDYNPELAAWSAENLPFLSVSTNSLEPPLPYEDGKFAFVYALSIFTHLPRELERAWLDELRRVLRPRGHLFFSVSGEGFVHRLSPQERTQYERGEPVVHFPEGAGTNLCATYHPPSYVRDEMLGGFLEIDHVSPEHHGDEAVRGALRQDGYLVKKLPTP